MEKTKELFDLWNKEKKFLHFFKNKLKIVKKGDIWISKIGVNVGSEISKDGEFSRPVLVIKTHLGGDLVSVIPFTTKYSPRYKKFLYEFSDYEKYGLNEKSYLVLNQFKIMSFKRLDRKLNNTTKKGVHFPLVDEDLLIDISNKIKDKIF